MPLDTGFLNQNLIRAFPFVHNEGSSVPNWLIVDFRAVLLEPGFDPRVHTIYLAWVARFDNRLRFGFRTDAPSLANQELVFERLLDDKREYVTEFVQSTPLLNTLEERCGCSEELLCNTDGSGGPNTCGPELLCNPMFEIGCSPELLCTPEPQTTSSGTTAAPVSSNIDSDQISIDTDQISIDEDDSQGPQPI